MVIKNNKFDVKSNKVHGLKEKGNKSLKQGNNAEAIFHYTHAIKLDPSQYQLYSNRSLAFLKMQQYYYALEDAKEVIRLKPDWAKGYYRKAEAEFQSENYVDALDSYRHALQLQSEDLGLIDSIRKTKRELVRLQKEDQHYPWLGAGLGFIVGVLLVVGDFIILDAPLLTHPFLKLLVVIVAAGIFFTVARLHRVYLYQSRRSLLQPPPNLLGDDESDGSEADDSISNNFKTGTKANKKK